MSSQTMRHSHPRTALLAWARSLLLPSLLLLLLAQAPLTVAQFARPQLACVNSPTRPHVCTYYSQFFGAGSFFEVVAVTEIELLENFDTYLSALVDPKTSACLTAERGLSPVLAFGVKDSQGTVVYDVGGVIFTKAGSGIEQLSDLKDKIVAATTTTDFASVHAVFTEYYDEVGTQLIDDAAMIEYLGTPDRVLHAVLAGDADVGLVHSGFLEEAAQQLKVAWEDITVLSQDVVRNYGERYPYYSSTPVYPDYALFFPDTADPEYRERVVQSVLDSNNDTDNYRFSISGSYAVVSSILEQNGVLQTTTLESQSLFCPRTASHFVNTSGTPDESFAGATVGAGAITAYPRDTLDQLSDIVICPSTHFKTYPAVIQAKCEAYHCHEEAVCFCDPCREVAPVLIHYSPVYITEQMLIDFHPASVAAFNTLCHRMEVCAQVTQPTHTYFIIEDQEYYRRENKDTLYFDVAPSVVGGDTFHVEAVHYPNNPHLAIVNITGQSFGLLGIEVHIGDTSDPTGTLVHTDASPFLVVVEPRACGENEEATQHNTCVCVASAIRVGSHCMKQSEYLPIFLCSAFALILIIMWLIIAIIRRRQDTLWKIDPADIVVNDPPEILGQGAFGVVIKGEVSGTSVAIKRAIPKPPGRKNGGTIQGGDTEAAWQAAASEMEGGELSLAAMATQTTNKGSKGGMFQFEHNNENAIEAALRDYDDNLTATTAKTSKGRDYAAARAEFMAEIRLLSRLRHPCVATMLGAVVTRSSEVLLVMEHLEHGSLYDFLRNDKMPTPDMFLLPIVKDIVSGMRYIHNLRPAVIHGDLKAKNVLVDGNFKAKISDFGLSQKKQFGCGTPFWMAPEVLRGGEVTKEADVYSFAITVYEIFSRKTPFEEEAPYEALRQIAMRQTPPKRPTIPESCPITLRELAHRCWAEEPKFRPTFDQVDSQLSELNISKVGASLIAQKEAALKKSSVLNDVFPAHIAKRLEEGKKVHPEHKDDVTIFFSDIVGFTNISAQLTPAAVSDMLDRLYSTFDELTHKHGVFKVETIGDAYMAATNLVEPQHDHALRIAMFAEEAVKAARSTFIDAERPELGTVNIRVGFHSGPVVANVVGKRNPRYCLFGDTVNTASRMESSSERSRIHMSGAAAERMRSQAPWAKMESRGVQNIKGKGEMHTYWLLSTKKPAKLAGSGVKFAEGDEQDHAAAAAAGEESKGGEGKQDDEGKRRASAVSIAAQQIMEEMRSKTGSHTSLASLVDSGRNRSIRDSLVGFLFKKKPGHTHFADSTNASARSSLSAAHLTHNPAHEQQQQQQQQEKEQEKKKKQQQQQHIRADSSSSSTHDGVEDSEMLDCSPPSSTANQPMHHAAVNIDAPSGGHLLSKQDAAVLHLEDGEDEGEDEPIDV